MRVITRRGNKGIVTGFWDNPEWVRLKFDNGKPSSGGVKYLQPYYRFSQEEILEATYDAFAKAQ